MFLCFQLLVAGGAVTGGGRDLPQLPSDSQLYRDPRGSRVSLQHWSKDREMD